MSRPTAIAPRHRIEVSDDLHAAIAAESKRTGKAPQVVLDRAIMACLDREDPSWSHRADPEALRSYSNTLKSHTRKRVKMLLDSKLVRCIRDVFPSRRRRHEFIDKLINDAIDAHGAGGPGA